MINKVEYCDRRSAASVPKSWSLSIARYSHVSHLPIAWGDDSFCWERNIKSNVRKYCRNTILLHSKKLKKENSGFLSEYGNWGFSSGGGGIRGGFFLEDWHNASHLHCNHLFCQKFRSLFVHICVMDADATEDSESLKGQATVNFISWGYHLTLILGRKGERDLTYFKQTLVVFVKWTSIYSVY